MRVQRSLLVATAVAGTVAGTVVGGIGPAEAAQPPEIHVKLVGTTDIDFDWTTHGAPGCTFEVWTGPAHVVNQPASAASNPVSISNLPFDYAIQLTCPGGLKSNKAIAYGPRNPLNDLRTQFNEASRGAFGS